MADQEFSHGKHAVFPSLTPQLPPLSLLNEGVQQLGFCALGLSSSGLNIQQLQSVEAPFPGWEDP